MENIRHNTATEDSSRLYVSPQVKVVLVKAQRMLCQSGNEPMREHDYGDGGLGEA